MDRGFFVDAVSCTTGRPVRPDEHVMSDLMNSLISGNHTAVFAHHAWIIFETRTCYLRTLRMAVEMIQAAGGVYSDTNLDENHSWLVGEFTTTDGYVTLFEETNDPLDRFCLTFYKFAKVVATTAEAEAFIAAKQP